MKHETFGDIDIYAVGLLADLRDFAHSPQPLASRLRTMRLRLGYPARQARGRNWRAVRNDLTHALGSDHLARLALRVIEPALLAVDRERQRADKAGNRAALLREQVRDLKAERDAFRFRAEAAERRTRILLDAATLAANRLEQAAAGNTLLTGLAEELRTLAAMTAPAEAEPGDGPE